MFIPSICNLYAHLCSGPLKPWSTWKLIIICNVYENLPWFKKSMKLLCRFFCLLFVKINSKLWVKTRARHHLWALKLVWICFFNMHEPRRLMSCQAFAVLITSLVVRNGAEGVVVSHCVLSCVPFRHQWFLKWWWCCDQLQSYKAKHCPSLWASPNLKMTQINKAMSKTFIIDLDQRLTYEWVGNSKGLTYHPVTVIHEKDSLHLLLLLPGF